MSKLNKAVAADVMIPQLLHDGVCAVHNFPKVRCQDEQIFRVCEAGSGVRSSHTVPLDAIEVVSSSSSNSEACGRRMTRKLWDRSGI